jgi:hypothetical protein
MTKLNVNKNNATEIHRQNYIHCHTSMKLILDIEKD